MRAVLINIKINIINNHGVYLIIRRKKAKGQKKLERVKVISVESTAVINGLQYLLDLSCKFIFISEII